MDKQHELLNNPEISMIQYKQMRSSENESQFHENNLNASSKEWLCKQCTGLKSTVKSHFVVLTS